MLGKVLSDARDGDTLVVWKLDRLGRSLPHLIDVVHRLDADGVGLKGLTKEMGTTTLNGRFIFDVFGALAELERDQIRERTQAGLAAARARGRKGGRPPKLNPEKIKIARRLLRHQESTVSEVAQTLRVDRSTLRKAFHAAKDVKPAHRHGRVNWVGESRRSVNT